MQRRRIQALLLDLDGTLFFKDAQIPGAAQALERLERMGLQLRFLTNTDSKTAATICSELADMGLNVDAKRVFTPATAMLEFLRLHPGKRCHCLLADELAATFLPYLQGSGSVDYVVVGDFRHAVSYERLNTAFRHIMAGAEIIALQKGRYFVRTDGYNLDTGAFVQLLEYSSGKTARILGKPSADFFALAMAHVGCGPESVAIVGDDVATDIAGARNTGALGVLVQTGKYSPQTLANSPVQPDLTVESVADLPGLMEELLG